jgi:predicted XRE-type DNA-binding protein
LFNSLKYYSEASLQDDDATSIEDQFTGSEGKGVWFSMNMYDIAGRKPDCPRFSTDKRINNFDRQLFMWLVEQMDKRNEVRLRQEEIATGLGVSTPKISASLKKLRKAGYAALPHNGEVHISPIYAWRDHTQFVKSARRKWGELIADDRAKIANRESKREVQKAM